MQLLSFQQSFCLKTARAAVWIIIHFTVFYVKRNFYKIIIIPFVIVLNFSNCETGILIRASP